MLRKTKPNKGPQELEHNPSTADVHHVNYQAPSGSMGSKKKSGKYVDPRTGSGIKVVNRESGARTTQHPKLTKIPKRKKKNMNCPIIVEDTNGEFPSVPLPLTLRHNAKAFPVATSVSLASFEFGATKHRGKTSKKVQVTTAACIKPSPSVEESEKNPSRREKASKPKEPEIEKIQAVRPCVPEESPKNLETRSPEEQPDEKNSQNSQPGENSETQDPTSTKESPRFYCFRNKVLAIMEADCKFSFHGKLKIRVLHGAVRIYGHSLTNTKEKRSLKVYAPRAWSPVAIEAIDGETTLGNISSIWKALGEECSDRKLAGSLESDVRAMGEGWAIVMLENFDDKLTNFLSANYPVHLFPRVEDASNHSWRDPRRAEIVLRSKFIFDDSPRKVVIDSRGIDDVADAICYDWETKKHSRTIVGGGKGVGKSTLSRYLVNKLLATNDSVVLLDLDPGQAEFTPAGCVSLTVVEEPLLGPNFTHLRTPYYQLYIGSADVTRCLEHYVQAIKKLVDRFNGDPKISHRPLVVNTMGFCKGIGWEIMCYVIKTVLPTDVVQILSKRSRNNFDESLSRQVIDRQSLGRIIRKKGPSHRDKPTRHRLHVIYSEAETRTGPAESWKLETHQQRELAMISYLSKIAGVGESAISRATSTSINAASPYAVPFSAMSVSLVGAFVPHVLSVMNGNIVALCGIDSESTEKYAEENVEGSYPRVLIRPPLSTCYGFGILRGVDTEKEQLYINAPLPLSRLRHVNCLVGSTNLPQCLLQLNQEGAPYTGSEYDLPTSRGPRRGYVRMRYQTET